MNDLVTITAAAKALKIDKSVLSRYLGEFKDLIRGTKGRAKLVNVAEVRAHRERNINLLKSANHKGELFDEGGDESQPANNTGGARKEADYKTAKTVGEAAAAQLKRLDLAKRLDQVWEADVVQAALADLGQLLKQSLEGRNRLLGEIFASMDDPRAIATKLSESDREVLEKVSDAIRRELVPDEAAAA